MRSMVPAAVAVAVLAGSSAVAFGQSGAVPQDLRGVWATGACEAPDEVLIYSTGGAIYLSIAEDFVIASTFVKVDSFPDGWYGFQEFADTPDGTYDFFARVEGDTLHEGWPVDRSLATPDELTPDDDRYVYGRCEACPPPMRWPSAKAWRSPPRSASWPPPAPRRRWNSAPAASSNWPM